MQKRCTWLAPLLMLGSVGAAASAEERLRVEYDEGCPSYDCEHALPVVGAAPQRVSASSTLAGDRYAPRNAADGRPETAWCEGAPGAGRGEWLRYEFDAPTAVNVILFDPSYAKSAATYQANGRVKRLRIEMEGGYSRVVQFMDAPEWTEGGQLTHPAPFVTIRPPVQARWLRFTILEVHPRRGSEDTCISEITILGRRPRR